MTDALFDTMAHGKPKKPKPEGPLNVIDENADKCCRKAFASVSRAEPHTGCNLFHCPFCGTEFRAEKVGPVNHWHIVEHFAIHRR